MALNIPLPEAPDVSFRNSMNQGANLYNMVIQHAMQRAQERRMQEQMRSAQENQKFNQGIIQQKLPYELKHLLAQTSALNSGSTRAAQARQEAHEKYMREKDPNYEINKFVNDMKVLGSANFGGEQPTTESKPKPEYSALRDVVQNKGLPQGQGMIASPEEESMQNPEAGEEIHPEVKAHVESHGIDFNKLNYLQKMYMAKKGFKVPGADVLHGPARDAKDLERLKNEVGEDSQVYKDARADYDAKIDAKKDLSDIRERTKKGLKAGEKEFFDEKTGNPLGKEIPLTAKERESEEGNILFNELYPAVYKGAAPFSGEGSIGRLDKAFSHYKTDPKAKKLVDDLLLSDKAMAATVVNEASTLKSGHTNQTYNRLQSSLESQDIPNIIKKLYKQYNLPASAQLNAAMRYQKLLSDARKKARKSTPATQKLYYDPEMQAKHEAEIESGEMLNKSKSVIVIDPTGNKFETTEENAAHLPKGWSRG